ncbi:hypothetical protein RN001_002975 [Aquatica leii]|uniref:Zinc finger CCCH domain-containing protein 14 n=1 Tax=Aquatica leii TaxID=1421715 RepID=A0AAN7PHM5_9COLE|nr:hypothetical protein RN001_002975 [Aquatica leii]
MDNIGAEVGQKMRSAIKAKLMELGCYVDDELPDYIMVMVANKRTKSQMNEDLQLFLATKTSTFVDWLQIVLKKLKEITVTNPDIYKRVSKRKFDEETNVKIKKEKKERLKSNKKSKKKDEKLVKSNVSVKSLTDDLPVQASKLSEMRKIVIMQESQNNNSNLETVNEDCFDIPPLSEVTISNEHELQEIEEKIKNVKSRLGLQVESDSDDEDFIDLKAEPEDLFPAEQTLEAKQRKADENIARKIKLVRNSSSLEGQSNNIHDDKDYFEDVSVESLTTKNKTEHPRIIFGNETVDSSKKISALERLGKKSNYDESDESGNLQHKKINLITIRKQEEKILGTQRVTRDTCKNKNDESHLKKAVSSKVNVLNTPRESVLKRLGVMSKVAVPNKNDVELEGEEEVINKDVPSAIKVKPRIMPPSNNQANKNLLLKAVAEAQRSIAQTPVVGSNAKPDALFTKKFREKLSQKSSSARKLSDVQKSKIKNILVKLDNKEKRELDFSSDDDNLEYVPRPLKKVRKSNEHLEYIPSSKELSDDYADSSDVDSNTFSKKNTGQTFIITLDGITRQQDQNTTKKTLQAELIKTKAIEEKKRKSPSPIIFDKEKGSVNTKTKQIPDKLPVIVPPVSLKTKERCKYWPGCRQGEKCEFIHPNTTCKSFPQCKFGEKCLYIHPMCKFETSCTKKDCPYSHVSRTFNNGKYQFTCDYFLCFRLLHKTHYEVLGLSKDCTTKDVKNAYITLSKKYHPDNNKGEESHMNFVKIAEAYKVLSKPEKRRTYDTELIQKVSRRSPAFRYPSYKGFGYGFDDPSFWKNRDKSRDYQYQDDSYYGIPGFQRLSNGFIASICVFFTLLCSAVQFYTIRHSYDLRQEILKKKSLENEKILRQLRSDVENTDEDVQIAIMERRLVKDKFR